MKSMMCAAKFLIRLAAFTAALGYATAQEPAAPPTRQELPKAEDVLNRYIEATGGRAAQKNIRSQHSTGVVTVAGSGISGTIAIFQSAPDKAYSVISLQGGIKIEEGSDGQTAWEISTLQGPRIKTGDERAWALRDAAFNPHLRWAELYESAECTALDTAQGRECYRVVLTPREGKPVHHCYDRESGLLLMVSTILVSPMGEIPTETTLQDYRPVDGVVAPHALTHRVLTQEILVRIERILFNAEIPAGRYDLPQAVRELLKNPPGRNP